MQRELTYHVPFERLIKLGRSAGRKVYPSIQWMTWVWIALLIPVLAFLYTFSEEINDVAEDEGIPFATELLFVIVGLVFLAGVLLLRRYRVRLMKNRANFDQAVRLKQDDGGLHVITDDIEYYLKWQGLTQMMLERDGIVVSHGSLFFLIPDKAFANAKIEFIWNAEVIEVKDHDKGEVTGIVVRDLTTGALRDVPLEGVFIAIGHTAYIDTYIKAQKLGWRTVDRIVAPIDSHGRLPGRRCVPGRSKATRYMCAFI